MPPGQPSARRRPQRARLDYEIRGLARSAYLDHYASDPGFRNTLTTLYAAHCAHWEPLLAQLPHLWQLEHVNWSLPSVSVDAVAWADAYRAAVSATAQRFGLDRLPDGEQTIHNWCRLAADLVLCDGRAPAAEWFGQGEGWGGVYPDLTPLVHITTEDEWDPRREPMAAARTRILAAFTAHLDAELARIAAEAESLGYLFHDTAPRAGQHIRWLFEHVALGKTYPELAARDLGWDGAHQTVANAVRKYASLLGIRLSRCPVTSTPTV